MCAHVQWELLFICELPRCVVVWQVSAADAAGVRAAVGDWREALALALAEYRRSMYFPRCACDASKAACAPGMLSQSAPFCCCRCMIVGASQNSWGL